MGKISSVQLGISFAASPVQCISNLTLQRQSKGRKGYLWTIFLANRHPVDPSLRSQSSHRVTSLRAPLPDQTGSNHEFVDTKTKNQIQAFDQRGTNAIPTSAKPQRRNQQRLGTCDSNLTHAPCSIGSIDGSVEASMVPFGH